MLRTRRAQQRIERQLEQAAVAVSDQLEASWFHDTPDGALCLAADQTDTTASKPTFVLLDSRQRRYLFKVAPIELAAAESCAYEIRALARKPTVPARVAVINIDGERRTGVLKPFIELGEKAGLGSDTAGWSELQRAAIATEHVWEWFLGNLDTNLSQYSLFTVGVTDQLPVNLDWDRALAERGLPSRFDKYNVALPNACTFLYADHVEGRTDLMLGLLAREAKRIRRLPVERVRQALERYARRCLEDEREQRRWVANKLIEQRRIEPVFKAFANDLVAERRRLAITTRRCGIASWHVHRLGRWCWLQLQFALHWLLSGVIGNAARRALRIARGVWLRVCQFGGSQRRLPAPSFREN